MSGPKNPWSARGMADAHAMGMDMWLLGMESAAVIGLRTMKLAMGDAAAQVEAERMVEEKIKAAAQLPRVMTSPAARRSPEAAMTAALRHYTRKVRANRRRLSGIAW